MTDQITIPLRATRTAPPARPANARELLPVPGRPQALQNRPDNAAGRIPTPNTATSSETARPAFDPEAIRREVESSEEYQALKNAGFIKENPFDRQPRLNFNRPEPTQTGDFDILQTQRNNMNAQAQQAIEEGIAKRADPLALDLDGDGLETTGIENGVRFDLDADGRMDQTSFVTGGDAFLALDANGNGRIDDGRELFGDQNGDANGYLALARYDDNSDGVIDNADSVFQQLRLFTQSSDGTQRLRSLDEAGINSLSLGYNNTDIALNEYDSIAQMSTFERNDGSIGQSGDLLLGYKTIN